MPGTASPRPTPDVDANRLLAALAWLWVLSVVILLVKKDSAFVQFHARQGALVFGVSVLAWVVLTLLSFLGPLTWVLQNLVQLVVFIVIVVGFLQALRGRWWAVPVLGRFASNLRL